MLPPLILAVIFLNLSPVLSQLMMLGGLPCQNLANWYALLSTMLTATHQDICGVSCCQVGELEG